jgi:hypothetical protein
MEHRKQFFISNIHPLVIYLRLSVCASIIWVRDDSSAYILRLDLQVYLKSSNGPRWQVQLSHACLPLVHEFVAVFQLNVPSLRHGEIHTA